MPESEDVASSWSTRMELRNDKKRLIIQLLINLSSNEVWLALTKRLFNDQGGGDSTQPKLQPQYAVSSNSSMETLCVAK